MILYEVPGWKRKLACRIARVKEALYQLQVPEELGKRITTHLAKLGKAECIEFDTLVLDLNGTLIINGVLIEGVADVLKTFQEKGIKLVILSGNVRGNGSTVKESLAASGVKVELVDLDAYNKEGVSGTLEKKLSWMLDQRDAKLAFIGNGGGDILAAGVANFSIAVCQGELMCTTFSSCADVQSTSIVLALQFLLDELKVRGTCHID